MMMMMTVIIIIIIIIIIKLIIINCFASHKHHVHCGIFCDTATRTPIQSLPFLPDSQS